jgi:ferrous iron transport protein B
MTTIMVLPFMSCSARLTIYALIIPAFFPASWPGPVLWMMYLIGIALAIAAANLFRSTVFKGESAAFLMELPPYHVPTARSVVSHMSERSWLYLKKAGTIILGISIVLWAMTTFPKKPMPDAAGTPTPVQVESAAGAGGADADARTLADVRRAEELSYSAAGRFGRAMEPLLHPMGFDWKIGTALIGAFAAKEVFVAQMGIVFSVGNADETSEALRTKLRRHYPPLVGFCIMLFCLIAAPCMATVAITKRETNSWRWALFQFGGLTALGYLLTVVVYQSGRFLGIGI